MPIIFSYHNNEFTIIDMEAAKEYTLLMGILEIYKFVKENVGGSLKPGMPPAAACLSSTSWTYPLHKCVDFERVFYRGMNGNGVIGPCVRTVRPRGGAQAEGDARTTDIRRACGWRMATSCDCESNHGDGKKTHVQICFLSSSALLASSAPSTSWRTLLSASPFDPTAGAVWLHASLLL
jgi:hypothetical protein